jgi:S1-C subfamily serine protease
MKRAALYSSTNRSPGGAPDAHLAEPSAAKSVTPAVPEPGRVARLRRFVGRHDKIFIFAAGVLVALACALLFGGYPRNSIALTQDDIDAAVLHTLETKTLPSRSSKAAEVVRRSVVRVRGFSHDAPVPKKPELVVPREQVKPAPQERLAKRGDKAPGKGGGKNEAPKKNAPGGAGKDDDAEEDDGADEQGSVGSGVVIVDDGTILTNLHVVAGAKRLVITFFDGFESEATVVAVQPDKDLAVIKAKTIPDDLPAATLGSTANLRPGDEVVAVGFPFGIGPSVSSGVVSGLNRGFLSPQGKRELTGLIQFDAAANPGNSGGPLVSMDGEVVGIVTAILNPTEARTFIGIGFATTIESAGSAVGMPPF